MIRVYNVCYLFLFFILTSCAGKSQNSVSVSFEYSKDSLLVIYKNTLYCPVFSKIENLENNTVRYIQSEARETSRLLKFGKIDEDSISILKKYQFEHYYGYHDEKKQSYDTTYNYGLPYLKGKQYKVIQGYNGSFTHNNEVSRHTIDFKMNIGDTVVATRDGVVIKVVSHHNKQGTTKKFRPFANYIVIYHSDNTIAQYVHLKQHSNLIKVGDSVTINQPIGLSGFTGWTTTPHLHFGIFKPTKKGLNSIPIYLNSLEGKTYKKNKIFKND